MAPDARLREDLGRKLAKTRGGRPSRSFEVPERLREGDDAHEDVTAPKGAVPGMYMNQSIFSMVAAAGSNVDFTARFDEESSDSSSESHESDDETSDKAQKDDLGTASKEAKIKEKSRKAKLFRSMPKLRMKSRKHKLKETDEERMSSSQILPPKKHDTNDGKDDAESDDETDQPNHGGVPVMSRMLRARAELDVSEHRGDKGSKEDVVIGTHRGKHSVSLPDRLMEIFGFESPEEVISEYPCWLLQSVLLQGYMYITQHHICFYAYLPKRDSVIAKSGYLSKRGRQNPRYNRYWFQLRGDVLSYYTDQSQPYFPAGNIDLRYGISACLDKDKGRDSTGFTVTTDKRSYSFKADSSTSAREWVKNLQKVIFRSHNDGDSVKISIPIQNVMDLEENPVLEFADTVKIRVIDNDDTYVIDDYFFSFFSFGKEALQILRIMIDANGLSATEEEPGAVDTSSQGAVQTMTPNRASLHVPGSPAPHFESVKATIRPGMPQSPRVSGDMGRMSSEHFRRSSSRPRASFDKTRTSFSVSPRPLSRVAKKDEPDESPHPQPSTGSNNSFSPGTESSAAIQSLDTNLSASQILNRSDVFQLPTQLDAPRVSTSEVSIERGRKISEDTTKVPSSKPQHTGQRSQRPGYLDRGDSSGGTTNDAEDDSIAASDRYQKATASTALQDIRKAGSYPFQRATELAFFLRSRSQRVSTMLATESMGYYEKVSGMWAGGHRHYSAHGTPLDEEGDEQDEEDATNHGDRFRAHFALPASEPLIATYFGNFHRVLPLYGKIYVSNKHFCYRSLLPGTRTKLVLPFKDIENVAKEKGYRLGYSAMVVVIRGHEELFFDFRSVGTRDDCVVTLIQRLEKLRYMEEPSDLTSEENQEVEYAKLENRLLQEARADGHAEHDIKLPRDTPAEPEAPMILFDDARASILNFKPTEPMRITCLTIGSRGDVQPYIALCKGFLADGHKPRIATHAEFEPWVRKHGIDFAPVEGDPAELMRICVENGMFTYSFLKEATSKFRGWLDDLMSSAWTACQDSDLLIESPSAMAGIHIAEALEIPYFRAFTMPWTRTRAYPHAFTVPEHKMGGAYNYVSYVMFDTVFWKAIANQVNRWRRKELGLGATSLDKMQPNKVPFLYNFSPSVVVPPLDYSDWIRVTGYWFLDEGGEWQVDQELVDFIAKARADNKKLVYVGFGSIVVEDPAALTKTVVDSVIKADVRCILSKGWSDRLGKKDASKPEVPLPPEILQIKSAPHDWLFRQVDAAAHHGGSGTTGASLRAGIPTIVKPFFGDQFFFGSRIEDLGVGICLKKINTSVFARALWEATHSERMIVKARVLGEQIRQSMIVDANTRQEDGVGHAIQTIYRDLEYAKSLIKRKHKAGPDGELLPDDFEETWTFLGDEFDRELLRKQAMEWEQSQTGGRGYGSVVPKAAEVGKQAVKSAS
ncbi:UDP-Glycosyltransferase/glycogen phosphorylase [Eremomyces bilateralis CBS 781.70]|uniref:Sterol 3-beta-glucosyltransferase n=1 Tax=Eremomyces bilateralis CBS 781.70 TaxID=1392243 RepID=A0A6G1GEG9_9PEZI|nr:UDP-Glycosyltransferase/glycogen phosphorylase [Eremomyces bilateralis CBS 781.70]KAF1816269.1 UDP-Glycosyltransferase/glycogen phosphorylase [Eremomyces bilateralis CBS 781.70]